MAWESPVRVLSFTAGEDLSAKQFYLVKVSAADTVVACAATTDVPIGVLQNAPASGGVAEVMVLGVSKLNSDAALAVGAAYGPAADGQAVTKTVGTDTTHYVLGRILEASNAAAGYAVGTVNGLSPARAV